MGSPQDLNESLPVGEPSLYLRVTDDGKSRAMRFKVKDARRRQSEGFIHSH